ALITLIGSGLALCIVWFSLPILSSFVELPLEFAWTNGFFWLGLLGLFVTSILIAGIYPAMLYGGFKPIQLFQAKKANVKGISLRKTLVISQFVAAIVTIICTLVIYQQLQLLQNTNLGYDKEHIIEFSPNLFIGNWQDNYKKFHLFEQELGSIPTFESVAAIQGQSMVDIRGKYGDDNYHWEGKDTTIKFDIAGFKADGRLLNIFNLEMAAGRWFSDELETDKNAIIFNETAIKTLKIDNPVGKKIQAHGSAATIIGIIKDYHFTSPKEAIQPLRIMYTDGWSNTLVTKVHTQNLSQTLATAEQKFKAIYPDLPFQYSFLDDTYQKLHESETKLSFLFRVFAGILLFISCLGLFGLATFAVERRTKEIGIRKVLGASVSRIIQLLSKDFIQLIGIALLISAPIAWYLVQNWLENYATRVSLSWQYFVVVGMIVIGVALLTVSVQSVKAALTNPVESLRSE
ncbi:MAG: ABC transporter permease, partial [Bacteroidota bacterium]